MLLGTSIPFNTRRPVRRPFSSPISALAFSTLVLAGWGGCARIGFLAGEARGEIWALDGLAPTAAAARERE